MYVSLRPLDPSDADALFAFLADHAASSLFLRSNAEQAGLVDDGERYQGTYIGAWEGEVLVGVAALYWNGKAIFQAPDHAALLAAALFDKGRRPIDGLIGPWSQVMAAREALSVAADRVTLHSRELLFCLPLAALRTPPPREGQSLASRSARAEDVELLTDWRVGYERQLALGRMDEGAVAKVREELIGKLPTESIWILSDHGVPVATTSFSAETSDSIQVGGVWTPPEQRSRGYGRAVVAAHLEHARSRGLRQAILFTGDDNTPAQRCYLALGFEVIGDYGMVFFDV